jgi:hypothetical protein
MPALPLFLALVLLAFGPSAPRADDVLVYQTTNSDPQGGDTAGPRAQEILQGLGHTVTLVAGPTPATPGNLSAFDSVWIVQLPAMSIFSGLDVNALSAYVRAGGGVYLTGERSCCETLNASVQNFVNVLTSDSGVTGYVIGNLGEGGDTFAPNPTDPFGLTTTPNVLTEWATLAAGLLSVAGLPADVRDHRVVFQGTPGAGAVAIPPEDLEAGSGCMYVAMDISYLIPAFLPDPQPELLENIATFLSTCGDTDGDGVSDQGETARGSAPGDPDSDGDGLCDGHGTVAGVCRDGEGIRSDTDGDTIIDPLDPDDDGDGLPTLFEQEAELACPNADDESPSSARPAWRDPDSDNDFIPDRVEGLTLNLDGDACPSIVDRDDYPEGCNDPEDCDPPFECQFFDDDGFCLPAGSVTTTTLPGGTTTTTLPTGEFEVCGNCLDDDGNGAVDLEDAACCDGAQAAALTLKRGRIAPRPSGNSKLALSGTAAAPWPAPAVPPSADVFVQVREEGGAEVLCARLPAANLAVRKQKTKFRDKTASVASAVGVSRLALAVKKDGSAKLKVQGKEVAFATPAAGDFRVTIGLRDPATAETQNHCASAVASFRAAKKGVRFP